MIDSQIGGGIVWPGDDYSIPLGPARCCGPIRLILPPEFCKKLRIKIKASVPLCVCPESCNCRCSCCYHVSKLLETV